MSTPSVAVTVPDSKFKDQPDDSALRHGREVHHGFNVGKYLQAPPFFFTRDKWPVPLVDHYRGATCILIAGGPSFGTLDHTKLREPGILTLGINNSVKTFRPNMWTCVDDPASFLYSMWLDPTIMKFVPISHIDKTLFNSSTWQMTDTVVGDCPNVVYYKRNEQFQPNQYLSEDTFNWGNHSNLGGGRSVMLAAIRIMYMIGIRRIFFLGVDFNMSENAKYHFEQERSQSSIRGNNSTYKLLVERFTALRPIFEANGLEVYNCNKDSGLKVFDHIAFDEAVQLVKERLPDPAKEPTRGLYDRKANEKNKPNSAAKKAAACDPAALQHVDQVKAQLNDARTALHEAKAHTALQREYQQNGNPSYDAKELMRLANEEEEKRKIYRKLLKVRDSLIGGN